MLHSVIFYSTAFKFVPYDCQIPCYLSIAIEFDRQVFYPITGQAVLPGGEVSGKEQLVGSDDEGHA